MIEKDDNGKYRIRCATCDNILSGEYDTPSGARAGALNQGWRVVANAQGEKIYCPMCAEKRA